DRNRIVAVTTFVFHGASQGPEPLRHIHSLLLRRLRHDRPPGGLEATIAPAPAALCRRKQRTAAGRNGGVGSTRVTTHQGSTRPGTAMGLCELDRVGFPTMWVPGSEERACAGALPPFF